MKDKSLVIFGKKRIWKDLNQGSSYYVNDSLYKQNVALSNRFHHTFLCAEEVPPRKGLIEISGFGFQIFPYKFKFKRFRRKLQFFLNLPFMLFNFSKVINKTDFCYILLPGEVGLVGIILALLKRKPTVVRFMMSWDFISNDIPFGKSYQKILSFLGRKKYIEVFITQMQLESSAEKNLKFRQIFSPSLSENDFSKGKKSIVNKTKFNFIYVGRYDLESKGIIPMFKAFCSLIQSGLKCQLTIIGKATIERITNTPGFSDEEKRILKENVHCAGLVSHTKVLSEIGIADLLFLFSEKEGFPKTVIEAYSQGVPAVLGPFLSASYMAGKNEERAIQTNNAAPEVIAKKIIQLLKSPSRYGTMSENCLRFSEQFTLESWSKTIMNTFDDLSSYHRLN